MMLLAVVLEQILCFKTLDTLDLENGMLSLSLSAIIVMLTHNFVMFDVQN